MNTSTSTAPTYPSKVTFNGVDYVPAEDAPTPSPVKIVVLQRGWVVVGRVTETPDKVTIHSASVIRSWGTTKGLGELRTGPTSSTKLDPSGTIEAHPLTVVFTMDVDANAWGL